MVVMTEFITIERVMSMRWRYIDGIVPLVGHYKC